MHQMKNMYSYEEFTTDLFSVEKIKNQKMCIELIIL